MSRLVISILVAIHTQSLRPHLKVQETLYLVNPFCIRVSKGEQLPEVCDWSYDTATLKKNCEVQHCILQNHV